MLKPQAPVHQKVTVFGARTFKESDYVKVRSLRWALIQSTWRPYKKRKFG